MAFTWNRFNFRLLLTSNMNVSTSSRISWSVRRAPSCDDWIKRSRNAMCFFLPETIILMSVITSQRELCYFRCIRNLLWTLWLGFMSWMRKWDFYFYFHIKDGYVSCAFKREWSVQFTTQLYLVLMSENGSIPSYSLLHFVSWYSAHFSNTSRQWWFSVRSCQVTNVNLCEQKFNELWWKYFAKLIFYFKD